MRLKSSMIQSFANLRTGNPGPLPAPVDDVQALIGPAMAAMVDEALRVSVTGTPATVQAGLQALTDRYRPDEIILNGQIFDHQARLRSFEIAAKAMRSLTSPEITAAE